MLLPRFSPILSLALLFSILTSLAQATTITWSGEGAIGTDPFGHRWALMHGSVDMATWALPVSETIPWDGAEALSEFHISFSGLPPGTTIGADTIDTLFRLYPSAITWESEIDNESLAVSFVASGPEEYLDPEGRYFTRVRIDGSERFVAEDVSFVAEFVMVPEPTNAMLFGLGTLSLFFCSRQRRARRLGGSWLESC
jgi:hypothetical protein